MTILQILFKMKKTGVQQNAKDGIRTRASEEIGALNRRLRPTRPPPLENCHFVCTIYRQIRQFACLFAFFQSLQKCDRRMTQAKSIYIMPVVCMLQLIKCFNQVVHNPLLPEKLVSLACSKRLTCHSLVLRGGGSSQMENSDELVNAPSILPEGLVDLANEIGDKPKPDKFENAHLIKG